LLLLLLVLQADFRYQPVLAHKSATSIHRTHSNASTYLEVFNVTGYQGSELPLFVACLLCLLCMFADQ
jgi:hypothetical protein